MKWRVLPAILLGLLLPIPLVWALSWLLPGGLGASETHNGDSRVVPQLSPEESRQLLTFQRPCRGNEDCDAPLVCLRGQFMLDDACVASECATDVDCREGFSCRSIPAGERVVRLCGATGKAKEGEFCLKLPPKQEMGCEPGLVCADRKCSRSCEPEQPQNCPEGYICSAVDAEGSVCLPTCEGRSCPEGQRCVGLGHGASVCARVHGTDCQHEPCPAEQVCEVSQRSKREGEVWMRCSLPCDTPGAPCQEGFMCMAGHCRQLCEPEEPGTCGPVEKCSGLSGRRPWVCVFDFDK